MLASATRMPVPAVPPFRPVLVPSVLTVTLSTQVPATPPTWIGARPRLGKEPAPESESESVCLAGGPVKLIYNNLTKARRPDGGGWAACRAIIFPGSGRACAAPPLVRLSPPAGDGSA